MWFDNEKIMKIFDMVNDVKTYFPCACPICDKKSAHIYIHCHDDRHCGIWTWCSSCGSYAHMSGESPKWWKNPDFVDENQLYSEPEYLETISDKIDSWVNSIIPAEKVCFEKPLILENKFKVKALVNYQDIPAGAMGTLVIKDDFRKITIGFIDDKGKKINLQIQPDDVAGIFEVIK